MALDGAKTRGTRRPERIPVRQIVEMAAVGDRHRNAMDRVAERAIDPPETVSP
ncbi:hypothetical protein AArcCO_0432 [Halalkaliarchaeum sp. AArc-CO]|nr:hypothetical protein AArcCO_0432 [Halalkaliarchaeum sp. AArc-CO]